MADHSFNPDVAEQVGVIAATIYRNIRHWCEHNRTNGTHIHDGRAWTYNSVRAWGEQYPYLSDKQIRTALTKLEEAKFIAIGEFNKDNRDRTKWYCDLRESICPQGKMHSPKRATPTLAHKGKPLPDNKPDSLLITPLSPPKGKKEKPALQELLRVLDYDTACGVIEHRKILGKPLTERAAKLLAGQFEKTGNANAAADQMIMNGWQGFKAEWSSPKKSNSESMVETLARIASDA